MIVTQTDTRSDRKLRMTVIKFFITAIFAAIKVLIDFEPNSKKGGLI